MPQLRICNFFDLETANGNRYRFQNYFIGETKIYRGDDYDFVAFRAEGALSSLNGENQTLSVLFPGQTVIIRLVELGRGNRLSSLVLTTAWLNGLGEITSTVADYFIGSGASFNEDTVELRFRSAMDSVGSSFPARTLTSENVGILPLNSELYLR
jgi:phage-related protein